MHAHAHAYSVVVVVLINQIKCKLWFDVIENEFHVLFAQAYAYFVEISISIHKCQAKKYFCVHFKTELVDEKLMLFTLFVYLPFFMEWCISIQIYISAFSIHLIEKCIHREMLLFLRRRWEMVRDWKYLKRKNVCISKWRSCVGEYCIHQMSAW